MGGYHIEIGFLPSLKFEPNERKDIEIVTRHNIFFFDFSINGNGFEIITSKDYKYAENKAYVIMKNVGSVEVNYVPRELMTNASWIALTK